MNVQEALQIIDALPDGRVHGTATIVTLREVAKAGVVLRTAYQIERDASRALQKQFQELTETHRATLASCGSPEHADSTPDFAAPSQAPSPPLSNDELKDVRKIINASKKFSSAMSMYGPE